jgi:hypothetical protein
MLALLLAILCHSAPADGCPIGTSPAVAAHPAERADEKSLKALAAWLKHYRTGKMLLHRKTEYQPTYLDPKDSFAVKFGLAPKGGLGDMTWLSDLEAILEQVAKLDSPEAAMALLEIAAVGLDPADYTREMAPAEVRAAGEKWLQKIVAQPARNEIVKAARGEAKSDKARAVAMQAAALRTLGLWRETPARATIEQQLGATDALLRTHAAEALGNLGDEAGAMAMVRALETEANDMVVQTIAQALRTLFAKHLHKPQGGAAEAKPPATPPEALRLAVQAAIKALGRSTWRADMTIVRLLDDFRSVEAVPALIAVLERFRDHPEEVQSGRLSGLLLHRTHELLVSMTGAVFPANQPEKWRELWERERDKLEVAQRREPAAAGGTAASGFCGIPVQGTRVLFILDLSGSMDFPMQTGGTSAGGAPTAKSQNRLDFAKRELLRAMDGLAPNAWFNLVTFNGNPKAKPWNKDLVQANEKNRERFRKFVEDLDADGGTNFWSAIEEGLKMKSLVYGARYETNCDEIFVLSDGAPSVGDVLDPIEILRLVKECNRFAGMRINTVYISSPDPAGQPPMPWMTITPEEMMKRMADQNGGRFVNL